MRLLIRLTRETGRLNISFFMIMTALGMVSDGDLCSYRKIRAWRSLTKYMISSSAGFDMECFE